jgi:putative flippase GtrA
VTLNDIPVVVPVYPLLLDLTLPTRLWEFVSVSIVILVTTCWNFGLNKIWTFRSQGQNKPITIQTTQYMIVGAIGTVENLALYGVLTLFLLVDPIPAEICAFIVSVVSNFLLNNFWTFSEKGQN